MTDRERWIVYPLLFFALMLGLADLWQRMGLTKDIPLLPFAGSPQFREIRCRRLVLEGIDDQPLAVLTQNVDGDPQLSMFGDSGEVVILRADAGGGRLLLVRDADRKAIFVGHDRETDFSGGAGAKFVEQRAELVDIAERSISLLPEPETIDPEDTPENSIPDEDPPAETDDDSESAENPDDPSAEGDQPT